ncbi:MAG TPA: elongation factor G [Actinomycetota bacterium]|nr:elongation factor G [Actinomycetota bacterium]
MSAAQNVNNYPPEKIRNVVLFGQHGAGKTTLLESLLHVAKATTRMGSISEGNTVSDFEPEEIKKTLSISLSMAPVEWKGHKLNILDSPGYADFQGDAMAAIRVADLGVMVVSAVDGVQVQHEILWDYAGRLGIPRIAFVNKLDRERADFHKVLEQLSERLGGGFAPVDLPLGEEHDFHGIADILEEKAYRYDETGTVSEEEMDEALLTETHQLHTKILDSVAESDDALLEKYLAGEELTEKEVSTGLHQGLLSGSVFPVLVGSSTKRVGIDRLADVIVEMGPAPFERGPAVGTKPKSEEEVLRNQTPEDPFSAFVFKTISDPYVGRISLFRVISGRLRPDSTIHNASNGSDERVAQLFTLRGKAQEALSEVPAGDIAGVAKLAHTHTGDTFADKANPIVYPPLEETDRSLAKAIAPKTKGDEDKLMTGLNRIQEEDKSLFVERNPETHQTLLWGTGETHLEVTIERLKRKFGVEVEELPLRIPYRETIAGPGKGIGRHVKQSGGHGQYGVCNLEIEPKPRGEGFEFIDKIFGGAIPSQFIGSVQKGIDKAMSDGVFAGYPVVDVKVTLVDGKYHAVDSSDMAFQIAGSLGFRDAAANAGVVLLEPIMDLTVLVPEGHLGDVMGDLNSKRGRIQGTDAVGARQLIKAKVPMSEIARYAIDLRSMTGGQGTFSSTYSHYEEVPAHLADRIVAEAQEAKASK